MHENANGTRQMPDYGRQSIWDTISWILNRSTFLSNFLQKKKKKKKKIEMTKDVSMLVRVTYSVVDAFQAHRPSPFALSPCPLAPSLSPKQRELDRSRCIRRN